MVPFLLNGDVVLVKPAATEEIAAGDVICYEAGLGRLILHRVIRRHGDAWIAKGDALPFTDVVESRRLLGKVVARERCGRTKKLDTRVARWSSHLIASVSPALSALVPLALLVRRGWRATARA
jgi:hypothetical protein